MLAQDVLGVHFKNPIGLSAGFDKNAELIDILPSVGFGFAEVGSITGEVCEGNAKPRLWRLPKSNGLVVYYGLKNDGCEIIAERLKGKKYQIPIGVSVAMTNCEATADIDVGIKDFAKAFKIMEPHGSYITINISCPNTVSGQPFIDPDNLEKLLTTLDSIPTEKPIFIKLSPDLTDLNLDGILAVAKAHRVHGIICANLTKNRDNPKLFDATIPHKGGVSGQVVQDMADKMLSYIYQKEGKRFVLVGCGGVFSAADAYKKIRLGATLIQMITGMIFEGPQVVSEINRGLIELLKRDGFTSIQDAVGVDSW
jgi:dihydroorotate dehydrogenase